MSEKILLTSFDHHFGMEIPHNAVCSRMETQTNRERLILLGPLNTLSLHLQSEEDIFTHSKSGFRACSRLSTSSTPVGLSWQMFVFRLSSAQKLYPYLATTKVFYFLLYREML